MRALVLACGFVLIGAPQLALGQAPATDPGNPSRWSCAETTASGERPVSWKRLAPNVVCDQKKIWTFPARLTQSRTVIPAAALVAGTVGLILLDHSDAPHFRRTTSWDSFNNALSGTNTALANVLVPASFYGLGLIRHSSYQQNTALLAGEAAISTEIVGYVLKTATQRLRPRDIAPNGNFNDTWFKKSNWTGATGFPSGHATTAFAIATVFARRYRGHRWVPYVAYGSAALIGFSRISDSAHFPSDVFFGAALGYGIGRVAVAH